MRDSFFWRNIPQQEVIMDLLSAYQKIDILEVGASTGEMVYTYAILFDEIHERNFAKKFKIDAIELNDIKAESGRRGIFTDQSIYKIPIKIQQKYFKSFGAYRIENNKIGCLHLLDNKILKKVNFLTGNFIEFNNPNHTRVSCGILLQFQNRKFYDVIFMQNVLNNLKDNEKEKLFILHADAMLKKEGLLICAGRSFESGNILKELDYKPINDRMVEIYNAWEHVIHNNDKQLKTERINSTMSLDPYKYCSIFWKV